jgi:hypothetical protein
MRVAIIITTLNSEHWIRGCLDSIQSSTYIDKITIVVDGASGDETVSLVKKNFPEVIVIECPKNYGYAGGNNVGIGYAMSEGAKYIFIANPDIRMEPTCLDRLVLAMDKNPDIAVIGPTNYGIVRDELEPHFRNLIKHNTKYFQDQAAGHIQQFYPIPYVVGCGMLLRCEVLRKVGLFDRAYVVYGEEGDLCSRILYHGGKVMLDTTAILWHLARQGPIISPRIQFYAVRGAAMNFLKKPKGSFTRRLMQTEKYLVEMVLCSLTCSQNSFRPVAVMKAALWINLSIPRNIIRRHKELSLRFDEREFLFKRKLWPSH